MTNEKQRKMLVKEYNEATEMEHLTPYDYHRYRMDLSMEARRLESEIIAESLIKRVPLKIRYSTFGVKTLDKYKKNFAEANQVLRARLAKIDDYLHTRKRRDVVAKLINQLIDEIQYRNCGQMNKISK